MALFCAKFTYILAIRNPVFRWESCKGSVCERVWRIAQVCAKKQRLVAGFRGWLAAASRQIEEHVPSMPEAEASRQLFTTGQKFQTSQAICSWLELVTQPSREVKPPEHPVWQNMTFHIPSHPTIYIPLYPRFIENFEKKTLDKTRLTHPQSLPKRIFKFLYSLPLHCQILERLFTKTFFHHIHFCERAIWCFGKQLGRNQFHIGWCYGQVAESGKLKKK